MIKELVMEVTNSLPDTATFDDIIEAIYTRIKIETTSCWPTPWSRPALSAP